MKLIPNTPYNNKSNAELKVFDALSECFCENDDIFAFHSLNIVNNPAKMISEADFVILCKYGLFVLEVKGGGIGVFDGKWQTKNKKGEIIDIQNPFKQAKDAFYYISKSIKDELNISVCGGYGVVFCDCEFDISSCEWDKNIICDARKFKNFEQYLKNLFDYYSKNILDKEEILKIGQFLRPNFAFNENSDDIFKEKLNQRLLYFNGTKDEKNMLIIKYYKAIKDKNILLICKNEFLKAYFQSQIYGTNIVISTIDSLSINKKRAMIDKFDFLIIYEAQNILNEQSIDILNSSLKNGLKNGLWCCFGDENFDFKKYLFESEKIYLKKNHNNCKIIEKNITNDYVKALNQEIQSLLNSEIKKQNITILSPFEFSKSSAFYLDIKITILDPFLLKTFKAKNITFARFKDFEGLENDIIIAIDIDKNFKENISAKSLLILLYKE